MTAGLRQLVSLALAVLAAGPAVAQTPPEAPPAVTLAETEVRLAIPEDACLLDRAEPADAPLIERQEELQAGSNLLLAFFVPCSELAELRGGERSSFTGYGLYLAMLPEGGERPADIQPTGPRDVLLEEMAAELGAPERVAVAEAAPRLGAQVEEIHRTLAAGNEVEGIRLLGVAYRSADLIGVAVARTISRDPPIVVGSVASVTSIHGIPLSLNLQARVAVTEDVAALAAEGQRLAEAFVSLNAEAPRDTDGWPWWATVAIAAALGLAAGAVIAALRLWRKG